MKKIILITALSVACASSLWADDEFFKFYALGVGNVGLRNTSEQPKIAVLSFYYFNGKHELKEFKVAGKSSIEIKTSNALRVEIIDHKDSK